MEPYVVAAFLLEVLVVEGGREENDRPMNYQGC